MSSMEYPVDYALICRHGCGRRAIEGTFGPRMGSPCDADLPDGRRCTGLFYYATESELHAQLNAEAK